MTDLRVLTGAPGSGKTAILRRVQGSVLRVDEPAREILAEQRAIQGDGTAEANPARFVDLLLQRSIDKHAAALQAARAALFDRGVPDCIAYARYLGVDPTSSLRAASRYRYHHEVLVARPWEAIYTTDDERRMTFEATVRFQELIEVAYREAGYTLVEVPLGSMDDRARFVEAYLARRNSS